MFNYNLRYCMQSKLQKSNKKFLKLFDMEMLSIYIHLGKIYPQKVHCKRIKLVFCIDKLVLLFQRFRIHPIPMKRQQQGEFYGLLQKLKLYHECFRTYFRKSMGQFELLLAQLGPQLRSQRNHFREVIAPSCLSEVKQY